MNQFTQLAKLVPKKKLDKITHCRKYLDPSSFVYQYPLHTSMCEVAYVYKDSRIQIVKREDRERNKVDIVDHFPGSKGLMVW